MADLRDVDWVRSSFCETGSCVEAAFRGENVVLRNSKDSGGPILQFTNTEWTEFLDGARNEEFDAL